MTIPAPRRTPGSRFDISYEGATNVGSGQAKVYLFGEILVAGSGSDGYVFGPVSDLAEVTSVAGSGSILEFMFANALRERTGDSTATGGDVVPLYGVCVAEPVGVAASQTFTFSSNATSDGVVTASIAGVQWQTTIDDGFNPTQSGDAFVAAFDNIPDDLKPPCSLVNVAGVVTATMNNKGAIGNSVVTVVHSSTMTGQTCVAGGSTMGSGTLTPTLTTALAAIESVDTDFLAVSMVDSTSLETIRQHIVTKSNSTNQLGSMMLAGNVDTVSNSTTLANTLHSNGAAERVILVCCEGSYSWQPAIAARAATAAASEADCARPVNGLALNELHTPSVANRYTLTDTETLLSYGCTPLKTETADSATLKIVRMVVCRSDILDPLDHTKIRTLDELRNRINATLALNINRAKLKRTGEDVFGQNCVTPDSVLSLAKDVCYRMETEDKLQGLRSGTLSDAFSAGYGGAGRVTLVIPADVVDGLHDIAGDIIMYIRY